MQFQGTTVMVVTRQKTKFKKLNQKFYNKKMEKKMRDKIIRNNRKDKNAENDIYSQQEYGRQNGSKPFQIYDRFEIVDRWKWEIDQQFMTWKEDDHYRRCWLAYHQHMDDYMDNLNEDELARTCMRRLSSHCPRCCRVMQIALHLYIKRMNTRRHVKIDWQNASISAIQTILPATAQEADTFCHSKGNTRMDYIDWSEAKKEIDESRHNLEMALDDYYWMSEEARKYLDYPYTYDRDEWMM